MKNNKRLPSRKNKIFDAAIICFNKNGYFRTSLDEIATKAGVTKAGIYYHFKSKKRLFIELFHVKVNTFFEELMSYVQDKKDPLLQLKYLFGNEGELIPKDIEVVKFCLEFMTVSTRDADIRKEVTAFYKDKVEIMSSIIDRGKKDGIFRDLDMESIARNLYFQSWGFFLINFTINIDFDIHEQHKRNLDLLLHGLIAKNA